MSGTCIHCDTEQDLVPICISCANKTGPTKSDLVENDTKEPVSPKDGGTPHHKITEALNRLKKECGYGTPNDSGDG